MNNIIKTLVISGIVLFIAYNMWNNHVDRRDSVHWPSTEGTITNSYVKEVKSTTQHSGDSYTHTKTHYEVAVEYEYTVDRIRHTGDRIEVANKHYRNEDDASDELRNYEIGKIVTVYFNPANPKSSVLKPG